MTLADFESVKQIPVEIYALEEVRLSIKRHDQQALAFREFVDSMIARRVVQIIEAKQIIDFVSDQLSRDVLKAYLTNYRKTFDVIADEKNYCLKTIQRAYRCGIDELVENGFLTNAARRTRKPL